MTNSWMKVIDGLCPMKKSPKDEDSMTKEIDEIEEERSSLGSWLFHMKSCCRSLVKREPEKEVSYSEETWKFLSQEGA